jgi:hypothetical protein
MNTERREGMMPIKRPRTLQQSRKCPTSMSALRGNTPVLQLADRKFLMDLSPEDRRDREKVNEAVRRYRESRKCT